VAGPNPIRMMRQLKHVKDRMLEEQKALAAETVEVSAGNGAVKVVMNGHQRLESVTFASELMEGSKAALVSELVVAAVNEAVARSQALASERMGAITRGLDLPSAEDDS